MAPPLYRNGMKHYFHSNAATGFQDPILFSFWTGRTPLGYLASGLLIMAMAMAFEGLRALREGMDGGGLPARAAAALVHMVAMTVAYFLMICVMSSMDWVFMIFVASGLCLGHLLWHTGRQGKEN